VDRRTYLYRLLVSWPSAADEYQWGRLRIHRYLTLRGAQECAGRLRGHGAVVDIERSLPVEWPEASDG
jgi:hypothetical protein